MAIYTKVDGIKGDIKWKVYRLITLKSHTTINPEMF